LFFEWVRVDDDEIVGWVVEVFGVQVLRGNREPPIPGFQYNVQIGHAHE
jgi:hypothetical protein